MMVFLVQMASLDHRDQRATKESEATGVNLVEMDMVIQANQALLDHLDRLFIATLNIMMKLEERGLRVVLVFLAKQDSQAQWDQRVTEVSLVFQAMTLRGRKENLDLFLDLMEIHFTLVD